MTRSWKRSAGLRRGAVGGARPGRLRAARRRCDGEHCPHTGGTGVQEGQGAGGSRGRGTASSARTRTGSRRARSGDVYVADTDNRRIQVFSAKGAFKRSYPFAADEGPQDVATDPGGSAWAAILQAAEARQLGGCGPDARHRAGGVRHRSRRRRERLGLDQRQQRPQGHALRQGERLHGRTDARRRSRRRATSRPRRTGRCTSSTG